MMICLQKSHLFLILTCEFFGIRDGSSQDLSGNCNFDQPSLCSWSNDKRTDHFDWLLWQGSTPGNNKGPASDHSGDGSYIFIETSHPRKYDEKARLNSPWLRGARRMTFYYSMYGSTVESLSVFVRINGSEERIWSRYGKHVSSNWTKGCVSINSIETYQIIIEAVAGVRYASNIAVDDLTFSTNLTCFSGGKPTPSEIFEVNCTFDNNYCGWRNMLTSLDDQIIWYRKKSGNQSQGTGQSHHHTGGGFHIFMEKSKIAHGDQSAQLLSPLIRGPKCLRFCYYMNGSDIGNLDVLLWPRRHQDNYLIWRESGQQGDEWVKASVDVGYTGESQVVLQATLGRNYTEGIAIDDVTLTDGLCDEEIDPQSSPQGNCDFDSHICFWRNDVNFNFEWTRRRGSTPNSPTGPNADHTSGYGMYIYIEASLPQIPGDTARLESPWMRGPQCMTFYYHMYGATMSCVVIYIRRLITNKLKPVWLKSQDRGERWLQGQISINETLSYQIIIDGIRGNSYLGDAALDDFSFQRGTCQETEETTYYVSSFKGKDFRISTEYSEHSLYSEEFRFTLEHPRGNPNETPYFIYSQASEGESFIQPKLDVMADYTNFPLGVVVLNNGVLRQNSRRVHMIERSQYGPMISLDEHEIAYCCKAKLNSFFYAYNVTESGNRSISGCKPGWFKATNSCYLFYFQSTWIWRNARNVCHRLGADLVVVNNEATMEFLVKQRKELKLDGHNFYIGLSSNLRWIWLDGENVSDGYNLWGPGQPDGDGRCGTLLNHVIRDLKWLGYGWRWNDFSCTRKHYVYGYICEQPLAVPLPMALFLLSGTNGTVDRSPNGATKAVSYNIKFAPGPYGNPNGSFFFSGDKSSYVELKNTGELDTRFSFSVFAWVHLDNSDGPIFEYGCSMWVSHLTLGIVVRYMDRKTSNIYLLQKESVLVANAWNFIGTTYDYHTGIATVWVNNNTVMLRPIGAEMELATQSDVIVGASSSQKRFRGRISCIQFYDQALSVDQITEIKARCNNTIPLACNSNFFPFHGGCFSITKKYSITWKDALSQCRLVGGTLAKISREGLRYAFSKLLEKQKPVLYNVHIGLTSHDDWVWIDGSPLNASFWMPGYPTVSSEIPKSCAVLLAGTSRLKNVYCGYTRYPLCEKKSDNSLSQRSLTQSSSVMLDYNPSLAIDKSYTTCFRSQKESNPWWRVTLEKPLYVESVVITDKIDCCPRDIGMIKVTVSNNQTGDLSCTKSLKYGTTHHYKVRCSPPARGSYVTVTLTGDNITLVLCYVFMRTFEFVRDAHGVLREGWYGVDYNSKISPTMRDNPSFKNAIESEIILRDFEVPVNMAENCIQRLTSYLQVPESGYYTFYVSCDDFCELWKHDVNIFEEDDKKAEDSRQPIVTVKRSSWHRQWNKYSAQISQSIFLDKCRLYRMEAFMREESGDDHISVGMRRPNGEYERPIPGTRLFWTKPGTRRLEVSLRDQKTLLSGFVGLDLRFSGFYRFCCEGVYCPDCPLELNISTLEQNVTVDSALKLSCVNISFMATFNTERQPGDSAMKVTYSFVENTKKIVHQRVLGNVHLQAVKLNECNFESAFCGWTNDKWKLSSDKTFTKYPAHFAYIDGRYRATLVSPVLPWKPFYQSVGLCLRFNFVMPAKSKSSLKVLLRRPNQGNPLSIWQLAGYHGEEWSAAQVAFPGVKNTQIIVEGEGFLDNEINVAIDDVIVFTENCSLRPYYAEPGFSCADTQFTCKNGECVKRNLLCDGYMACKDGSDEDDCECPFSMFQCQGGGCLLATKMCNGVSDCINRDDENNCRNPCPSSYQCPDGTCISWSNTCSKTPFCMDGANTPSVCEFGNCHLNDLACISKNSSGNQRCKSFRGHCSFESENCGLKTDKNATLYWTVGSAQRTRESTGPSYDHTLFNEDGSYISIDAFDKNLGDKARLLSGWMEANQAVCLQFWYNMHGLGIGNLSIFMKTNQTETFVWRLSGDQGKRWRFGQTALNNPSLYKFVIEGTIGAGNAGDIALDDLTVFDGICETITRQASPDCDFDEGMCDWDAQEGWSLDKRLVNRFETRGGFVASLPAGTSGLPSFLSSPVINSHAYEWKCLRFWYFIGSDDVNDWYTASLMVNVREITSNQTILLFFEEEVTDKAQYTQIPLPSNYTNAQIDFVGWSKFSVGPSLAVDDVSFSKELCQQIPWKPTADPVGPLKCQEALGMETGTISDGQISASSQLDVNHAAKQGRLHCKAISQNSWSAGKNDVHQWLQVDLGSRYTKVTRVATQGIHDAAQWVTKYKLLYSNDGVNFQYYREQGQTIDKNFTGNTDQDTVVYHELNPPIRARYIRFGPEAWQGHISMRVELYGCLEECQEPLGMENGAISNGQITASSEWDVNHAAIQGRLNFQGNLYKKGSWSARGNKNQWLQVDLGSEHTKVTRVATQGRHDYPQWVTKYKLQYSNDGVNFQYYREQRQAADKEFAGNTDQETVVFHELKPAIKARYVRFRPEDWLAHVSMRVELYGCQEVCQEAMGMKDGAISDGQITASSQYDSNHAPFQGRLDFTKRKAGSWSASKNDLHQWLQVDLGSEHTKVTRVATQGRHDYPQWVTKYKLQYSNDGANFQYYREQGQAVDKDFAGNDDRDAVVYHDLNPPIKSRYVRFRPIAWHAHVSMRVELYGCQEGTVGDCQKALGMENGTISDGQISASSQWTADYAAVQGRLHFKVISQEAESWSARKNDLHQWLQVDLGSQYTKVTRLATQGRHDHPQWVTKYKLQYSNDGVNFQFYREQGLNADKDFIGNTDQDTVVFHALNPPIKARYIRFQPEAWRGWISMRVELYGCVECQETLGMESSAVSDAQITTSSQLGADHPAIRGRLQCESTSSKEGSWSAGNNDENQWLQVDLGSRYTKVTRVATQGIHDAAQWVTKYKLQYSNDGVNFQDYRKQGETVDKQFVGNIDQDSVVSHELNPPIKARYVRFRPQAWHNHISMRVKLYGCQDDSPCDISVDWCGWTSVRGWKRIKYEELDKVYQDDGRNNDDVDDEKELDSDGDGYDNERIFDPGNYEIHLPHVDIGYLSFYDIAHLHVGFTLCFWLKTEHSGFFIEYKVAKEQNESLLLGIYCLNNSVSTQLANKRSEVAMCVADDTWHHVCLSWVADRGSLAIFKDGERKYQSGGFWSSSKHLGIQGGGTMTIGFRARNKNASVVLGTLSGFNVWSYAVSAEEILRMSHGCGDESGDAKAWETVKRGLKKEVAVKWSRTCNDRKGERLVVDTNAAGFGQSAVLLSPPYNRSRDWHSKCLKFRYMLRGSGKKKMTVYQKIKSYREIPIWISRHNNAQDWSYGQVPLSAVSEFQVLIKGETEKKEDLIAVTGLYIDEWTHCTHQPLLAKQACSENLFNMSGYFFSPSFPGYYLDDMFCTWHITVPSGYVIQLEFQEFRLKDHPTCQNCFLQIVDGHDVTRPSMGRFCGYDYPPVFVSSTNHFTIVLLCRGNFPKARFKALYHSVAAHDDAGSSCSRQQGCPSGCKCEEIGKDPNKKILVTGEDLRAVPSNLPSQTGAVFFQQNRISRLREKDFANLIKLEYIDMSFNILLHLEEECFKNVSSVETLRLNSNFFRSLPVGAFAGLPNLRILDLGRNFLHKAVSGMFHGLANLEVLSMRSNQLRELKYGVFDNKGNLTHLYLQDNTLSTLPDGLFGALSKLKVLNLSSNELTAVTRKTFQGLKSIEYMYLDRNKLSEVPSDAFSDLTKLKYLKLDRFILCCYAEKSIVGVDCESPVDEFSSCEDLMKNKMLQICIWILGILAFLGNLLVIIWRIIDKEENRVNSFLLTNLAVADMLMGVYMLTIAIMDLKWRGNYFMHDINWRSGIGCQIAGALSMLSSEVSVLILTIITLDRLISIVFPFKFNRLTYKTAFFACIWIWIFGVVISLIPITGLSYFYDESGHFGFYSRSAVCLPLQLSEGRPAGWEYSVVFFVCLNFISFTFILVAYMTMFWTVKRASRAARSTNLNKESAMAKRLVFIVMTDFCCWMPIIIINILSLTGNFDDPNKIAYVWIAVFVLPLNSSLNPILYTFSTDRTKRNMNRKRKNVVSLVMQSLNSHGLAPKKRQLNWQKLSGDSTLLSKAVGDFSPQSSIAETQERAERTQKHAKLRLIENVNILQDDIAGKRSTGYVTAWWEEGNILRMVLLKYFGKGLKEDWIREVEIVKGLSCGEEPHACLLHYCWHSKAHDQNIEHGNVRIQGFYSNSFLICYDFVSSSTLEAFLSKKGTVLNFNAVCAIACDVISAIEQLQDLGILHNNITTSNILIEQIPRLPPIRAVLGGFSQASKLNEAGAFKNLAVYGHSNYGNDIKQFGQLLATLLGLCHGSSEYTKLHEIMNLCFEEPEEKRHEASYIRGLLEEAWSADEVWDTYL